MSDVLLLDLNNMVHRAYHGGGKHRQTGSAGMVAGWVAHLLRVHHPRFVAGAVDRPWATWRHELAPEVYKVRKREEPGKAAERAAIVGELLVLQETLGDMLGVQVFGAKGFEGDDVIASLAAGAKRQGLTVMIATKDKDFCQIIDESTRVVDFMTGEVTTTEDVVARYGLGPARFIEYLALVGDASDGYPGCPGIGEKTAPALLACHESIEALYASVEERARAGQLKTAALKKLLEGRDQAFLSLKLARFRTDVPGVEDLDFSEIEALPVPEGFM